MISLCMTAAGNFPLDNVPTLMKYETCDEDLLIFIKFHAQVEHRGCYFQDYICAQQGHVWPLTYITAVLIPYEFHSINLKMARRDRIIKRKNVPLLSSGEISW